MNNIYFKEKSVETPVGNKYRGLSPTGEVSAVIVLRAGAAFEVTLATLKTGLYSN
jgi:uridine kinase